MTGVPATPAMHFRNGAVAFAYVATLPMEYVDEHKVSLNDTISRWMPKLPERLGYAFRRPVQFAPGKNRSYAHTNFMFLGQILP